ncbi:hypothetical protein MSG28_012835 [Choristoneura fumiferana]|uniref:Uncharacterized protein n=1 Tax=Choristoneura fumiferana TaxID=7141 RepID=A0ACC0JIB8_CHOFU|nr:hypothetical protein MSG28_012835 [Choristoneura fumiferana]
MDWLNMVWLPLPLPSDSLTFVVCFQSYDKATFHSGTPPPFGAGSHLYIPAPQQHHHPHHAHQPHQSSPSMMVWGPVCRRGYLPLVFIDKGDKAEGFGENDCPKFKKVSTFGKVRKLISPKLSSSRSSSGRRIKESGTIKTVNEKFSTFGERGGARGGQARAQQADLLAVLLGAQLAHSAGCALHTGAAVLGAPAAALCTYSILTARFLDGAKVIIAHGRYMD